MRTRRKSRAGYRRLRVDHTLAFKVEDGTRFNAEAWTNCRVHDLDVDGSEVQILTFLSSVVVLTKPAKLSERRRSRKSSSERIRQLHEQHWWRCSSLVDLG